jgi:hypothetical protein
MYDADRLLAAANMGPGLADPPGVVIIRTKAPYDPDKIRKTLQADKAERVGGHLYYKIPRRAKGDMHGVAMPNNRVLILSDLPEPQLATILSGGGKQPSLPPETLTRLREMEKSSSYALFEMKGMFQQQFAQNLPMIGMMAPELQPIIPALQQAKALTFRMDHPINQKVKVRVGVACANDGEAAQMANTLGNAWKTKLQPMLGIFTKQMPPQQASWLEDVKNTLSFGNEGSLAEASADLPQEMLEMVARGGFQMPGMGMAAPPQVRPGPGPAFKGPGGRKKAPGR